MLTSITAAILLLPWADAPKVPLKSNACHALLRLLPALCERC